MAIIFPTFCSVHFAQTSATFELNESATEGLELLSKLCEALITSSPLIFGSPLVGISIAIKECPEKLCDVS